MMQLPVPLIQNVVLVGGGHAHALVLRKWAMKPLAGVRLTLISPGPTAPYTGMLPGFVAGHYSRADLDIDLVRLANFAGARLILGIASSIDREAQTVTVAGRPPIPYDLISINVGITSDMPSMPGFSQFGTAAKPLGPFSRRWTEFVRSGNVTESSVAVIGGGVGGCELAMAMNYRLKSAGRDPKVTLIDRGEILSDVGDRARAGLRSEMEQQGISVLEHTEAVEVTSVGVTTNHGGVVPAAFVVSASGARPYDWVADVGLTHTGGFLTISETLQSLSDPKVFAVGDCADMAFDPRPKAGVFAVRQAPILHDNIRAVLTGQPLVPYDPQKDFLKLISLGGKRAGADKFERFSKGRSLWRLKHKIDTEFMAKLADLPKMETSVVPNNAILGLREAIEDDPPLCGGCGAKVGADVLAGPLAALPPSERSDITRLPGDDAAVVTVGGAAQVLTTDQLRSFTSDPYRMAKISALHAMGDIWAMGAAPQAALVTVTLPQLSGELQAEWLHEIMAGASAAIGPTGAEIVGGHTSMGAELALGFSLTGLLTKPPITLAGARVGQTLILTRPLGSGLLLAADMQFRAAGHNIASLLETLETPQGDAATILASAGASAMTDVTGFGLAGHLLGMLRQSDVGAQLRVDSIPLFEGVEDVVVSGIRPHLFSNNRQAIPAAYGNDDPRVVSLVDPQTAGGFLAAVPMLVAEPVVESLRAAGHGGWAIGTVVPGPPEIALI